MLQNCEGDKSQGVQQMKVRAVDRWHKFLFSALVAAAAGNAADWQTLSRWRFSRDGGKTWESVSVPHDWAIAGPFDPAHDMQKVKILENGEERETE